MLDVWKKEDPPTMKKLPIKVGIPKNLVQMSMDNNTGEGQKAIANLTRIVFYYLLWLREYMCK